LTRGAIASPLYVPNRTKENDEAAHKQNDECKSIACHFWSLVTFTIGLVDFKHKGGRVICSVGVEEFLTKFAEGLSCAIEREFGPCHPRRIERGEVHSAQIKRESEFRIALLRILKSAGAPLHAPTRTNKEEQQ
jgi:hypothetical protein